MAKDIFGEDYFNRHRNESAWGALGKKKLHEALNLKHKPKPKLEEVLPQKEAVQPQVSKPQVQEEEFYEEKPRNRTSTRYFQNVLSGIVGGFIVVLVLQMNLLEESIASVTFWTNAGITVIMALIFIAILTAFLRLRPGLISWWFDLTLRYFLATLIVLETL